MIHPSDITLTDDFCGCGGSSQGAKQVVGVRVKYARNHWPLAIRSHNTNHPDTEHDCVNLSETHPGRYERTTGYIASPECTFHSNAGGRKRKNLNQTNLFEKQKFDERAIKSRATMWDVVTFAEWHRHEFVIVENVVQVRDWELFPVWLRAMHNLGYYHECVYLNAMFAIGPDIKHFAPQSRDRIYIVFWKKGNKKPDLRITPKAPCMRCGDVEAVQVWKKGCISKVYGDRGGYLYHCPNCHLAVTPYYYAALNCLDLTVPMVKIGEREAHKMRPLSPKTIQRIEYGLRKYGLRPTILDQRNGSGNRTIVADSDPLQTQTTQKASYLFSPFLFEMAHTQNSPTTRQLTEAMPAQTTQQSMGFVSPFLLANRQNSTPQGLTGVLHTVATGNHEMLIDPAGIFNTIHRKDSTTNHAFETLNTVSAGGINVGLVIPPSAILTMRGSRSLDGLTDPIAAQTSAIQSYLMGATPFLQPYHGTAQANRLTEPTSTIPTRDSMTLIETRNQPAVEDCYFRMLQPRETGRAQGFPGDYVILGTKDEQQIQIGNANPPSTMELIVGRCVQSLL